MAASAPATADPLLALRAALSASPPGAIAYLDAAGAPVAELSDAASVVLPDPQGSPAAAGQGYKWELGTVTRFARTKAAADAGSEGPSTAGAASFHTLQSLLLAYLQRHAGPREYMREATVRKLPFLSITERKGALEWLMGKREEYELVRPVEGQQQQQQQEAGGGGGEVGGVEAGAAGVQDGGDGVVSILSFTAAVGAQSSAAGQKRRYQPNKEDQDVVKRIRAQEVEIRDARSVLRGIKDTDFGGLRGSISEKISAVKSSAAFNGRGVAGGAHAQSGMAGGGGMAGGQGGGGSLATQQEAARRKKGRRGLDPIIIVPSSPTSLITIHNVKQFLENAVFVPSEEARKTSTLSGAGSDIVAVYRKRGDAPDSGGMGSSAGGNGNGNGRGSTSTSTVRYLVVDGVDALSKLGGEPWDRVVCVLTTGQAWQFRPYKWSEPKELFHHVKGVHISWTNDAANPNVKDWNVTELKVDRTRRHLDKSTVAQFWKTLEGWH